MQVIAELLQEFWLNLQQGQLNELGPWTYIVLSLLIVWQGPIATLLGGAAAATGLLRPEFVFLAGITGNLTADILWYSVGRRGNFEGLFSRGRLEKYRPRLFAFKSGMRRHAPKFLLLAKLSFGLAVPTLVAAGMSGLSWRKWFPIVFIGETIWTGTLVLIGFFAAEMIKQVEQGLQLFLVLVSFLLVVLFVWYIPKTIRENQSVNLTGYEEKNNS
jgi:membrane protein DedA with SNARE-associated domain